MSHDARKPVGRIHLQSRAVPVEPPVARAEAPRRPPPRGVSFSDLPAMRGPAGIALGQLRVELATLKLVPRVVAFAHKLLPFREEGDDLDVVMAHPDNRKAIDELEFVTGKTVRPHAAIEAELVVIMRAAYDAMERGESIYVAPARPTAPAPAEPAPQPAARPPTRARSTTPAPQAKSRSRTPPARRRSSSTALQKAVVAPSTPMPRRPPRDSRSDDE